MRLVSERTTNYRSVEDSDTIRIEPDVTALVGKNESGKTATLQALFRLNPIEPTAPLDEYIDFPARLTGQRGKLPADELIPVVEATFEFEDAEIEAIERDLGLGALNRRDFTVQIGYRLPGKLFSVSCNEGKVVAHLRSTISLPPADAAAVASAKTIAELLRALQELAEPTSPARDLAARLAGWSGQDLQMYVIDTYASPWMPKFVYFAEYDAMPGKVAIPDLIARRDHTPSALTRGERALLSLMGSAGIKLEEFQHVDNHERLVRETENAGNVISQEVFQFWSQNTELEMRLTVLQAEQGAKPPLDQGPILGVRVYNRRHLASVPFDDRSRGFVWFFSFLAYFSQLEEAQDDDLILLLDEPGLSLHGRAQEDLLRLIDERLAPKHQVIYTTHSPFMVSPKHLHRVRTVIDRDRVGTKVSEEIFKADNDTAFPLLAAMGIEMSQTLFVGEDTLLREGPSDLIYLDVLTDVVEGTKKPGLSPRWVKTPVGGAGKLSTFATLLGANHLHVAVLVDSSTKDVGAVKRLRENNQLAKNGLVEISEFTGTGDADVEDLFERDFYLDLVNRAYAAELDPPIMLADLNTNDPRIVRQIEAIFKQRGVANGVFNHYKPAVLLQREQATLACTISAGTITRAAQLFERLNDLLP